MGTGNCFGKKMGNQTTKPNGNHLTVDEDTSKKRKSQELAAENLQAYQIGINKKKQEQLSNNNNIINDDNNNESSTSTTPIIDDNNNITPNIRIPSIPNDLGKESQTNHSKRDSISSINEHDRLLVLKNQSLSDAKLKHEKRNSLLMLKNNIKLLKQTTNNAINEDIIGLDLQNLNNLDVKSINNNLITTTQAFLTLLRKSQGIPDHVNEMRERRKFLENAAINKNVSVQEREVAKWLTHTYLASSQTNLPWFGLENHIKIKDMKPKHSKQESFDINGLVKINNNLHNEINRINIENVNRLLTNNDNVNEILQYLKNWDEFDIFSFVNECGHLSLPILMLSICKTRGLIKSINLPTNETINYMATIDGLYRNKNPYHNNIHACDVVQSMHYFMESKIFGKVNDFDKFCILIAASAHDVGHPGNNNLYEINTESELAITYNDQSVLENYHISLAWRTLSKPNCNILKNFDKTQKSRFRHILITSILATDMSKHSNHSETLNDLISKIYPKQSVEYIINNHDNMNNNIDEELNKMDYYDFSNKFLPIVLHTADLGNPVKPIKYYQKWVDNIMKEFFDQGDKEREKSLPISMLCDRFKVNIHAGQVGFINFVIRPWYERFSVLLNDTNQGPKFLTILNENFEYMKTRANASEEAQQIVKNNENVLLNNIPEEPPTPKNKDNDNNNNNNNNNVDISKDKQIVDDDSKEDDNNNDEQQQPKQDFKILSVPLTNIHSYTTKETEL